MITGNNSGYFHGELMEDEEKKKVYPPLRVEIRKVKGGYIVHKSGGKSDDYMNNEYVFESYADAAKSCEAFLSGKSE